MYPHTAIRGAFAIFAAALLATNISVFAVGPQASTPSIRLTDEQDLVSALLFYFEEAVHLSSGIAAARESRLSGYAQAEISKRTKDIIQLQRWHRRWFRPQTNEGNVPAFDSALHTTPNDELSYSRSMLRNHASLSEIVEFGFALHPRKEVTTVLRRIEQENIAEIAFLHKFSVSR